MVTDRPTDTARSVRRTLGVLALCSATALLPIAARDGEDRDAAPSGGADAGYVGAETCAECHADVVDAFRRSPHAYASGYDVEGSCESCHGPGAAHSEGDLEAIAALADLPPHDASATCLDCHEKYGSRHAGRTLHDKQDVGCLDCHSAHSASPRLLETRGVELCGNCHGSIAAEFDLPRHHPIADDGAACESCHDPHASTSLRGLHGTGNETCENCHAEKSGPFLFAHDSALIDGCSSCHRVHGSANRHLLLHDSQINLCYSCHTAALTPGFHSAPRFANEKCTACHTAIHGSNTNPFFLEE